jgi:RHS repeat-associated protein
VYLLYDGHGSVRQLADVSGNLISGQTFDYDAYGNLVNSVTPQTNLLYAGEIYDSHLGFYYNRARWYDPATGRFNRIDPFEGNNFDPQSLHKYT